MARGFESKSVESQQLEERIVRGPGDPPTREELERRTKREGLELSRRRILNELKTAKSETHRAALQNALAHLERELSALR
jgi:hypothetical protein